MAILSGLIIVLSIIAVLAVGASVTAYAVKRKVRSFSRQAFGTDSFLEGLNKNSEALADTPKSVSDMTRVLEPSIMRDFPDMNIEEFMNKMKIALCSSLEAIEKKNAALIKNGSDDLKAQIQTYIEDLNGREITEYFDGVRIHKTGISNYEKRNGLCVISMQAAFECIWYLSKNDKVTAGSDKIKTQFKYEVKMAYVQDIEKLDNNSNNTQRTAFAVNCPNCGAAVPTLGEKYCIYCGAGILEIHAKVWKINSVKKVN